MARSFDGSTSLLSRGDLTLSDYTIALWFYFTGSGGANSSIHYFDNYPTTPRDTIGFKAYYPATGGTFIVEVNANGTGGFTDTGVILTANKWYFSAISKTSTTGIPYLGATAYTGITVGSGSRTYTNGRIGCHYYSGANQEFFDGRCARWSVWNIGLSAAQIALLSGGVSPLCIRPDALVDFAPLGISSPDLDLITPGVPWTVTSSSVADNPPVTPLFPGYAGWRGNFTPSGGTTYNVSMSSGVVLGSTPTNTAGLAGTVSSGVVLVQTANGVVTFNAATAQGLVLDSTAANTADTQDNATEGVVVGYRGDGGFNAAGDFSAGLTLGTATAGDFTLDGTVSVGINLASTAGLDFVIGAATTAGFALTDAYAAAAALAGAVQAGVVLNLSASTLAVLQVAVSAALTATLVADGTIVGTYSGPVIVTLSATAVTGTALSASAVINVNLEVKP